MLRTFRNIRAVEPGFEPEGVLTFRVRVPERARETTDGTVVFYNEVRERVRAVPGVQAMGAAVGLPLAGAGFAASRRMAVRFPPPSQTASPRLYPL